MLVVTMVLLSNGLATGWEHAFPPLKNAAWEEECGACHMAFTPGMLPARSWIKTMQELHDHFGEDAALDAVTADEITDFLVKNAADNPGATDVMRRIAGSIAPAESPLRITEGKMFRYFHDDIPDSIWQREKIKSRLNCVSCHTRAQDGRYLQREIKIPKE